MTNPEQLWGAIKSYDPNDYLSMDSISHDQISSRK